MFINAMTSQGEAVCTTKTREQRFYGAMLPSGEKK